MTKEETKARQELSDAQADLTSRHLVDTIASLKGKKYKNYTDLARLCGTNKQIVSVIMQCNGNKYFTLAEVVALSKALGYNVSDFYECGSAAKRFDSLIDVAELPEDEIIALLNYFKVKHGSDVEIKKIDPEEAVDEDYYNPVYVRKYIYQRIATIMERRHLTRNYIVEASGTTFDPKNGFKEPKKKERLKLLYQVAGSLGVPFGDLLPKKARTYGDYFSEIVSNSCKREIESDLQLVYDRVQGTLLSRSDELAIKREYNRKHHEKITGDAA